MKKLKNIKIIFIDIDGTLVNSKKQITRKTSKAIKKITNKGIYVILISGRDRIHTTKRSKNANASSIVISSNGAEIYDYLKDKIIFLDEISTENIKKIVKYCEDNKIGLLMKSTSGRWYNKYAPKDEKYKDSSSLETLKDFTKVEFSQAIFISNNEEKVTNATNYAISLGLEMTNFSGSFLEKRKEERYRIDINNPNINKASAVKHLLKHLKIKKEESLCFGDFINDIGMFNACGYKVAMDNACIELKEKSDYITKSNDKNGVAYFLDKYL